MKLIIDRKTLTTKKNKYLHEEVFESKKELQKKNLDIVLLEEEFYSECLNVPRCKRKYIDFLVESEVNKKFKDKNEILYNYSIIYKGKENIKILINYIDSKSINCLKPLKKLLKINSVYPIQILASRKIKRKIGKDIFIAIFTYKGILYGFTSYKKLILGTSIIREDESFEMIKDKIFSLITISKDIVKELNEKIPNEIYFFKDENNIIKISINNISEELEKIWSEYYELQI